MPTSRPPAPPPRPGEIHVAAISSPQHGSHPRKCRSDAELARRAQAQHGVLTLAQLEALGLSGRAVRNRVANGRLHRVHRGVFSVETPSRAGRWMAAVLAAGPGALLSHRSAAAHWGLVDATGGAVDVTVPRTTGRTLGAVRIHCAATLRDVDSTACDRIPCTAVPRTLLDLAATVDRRSLERAVDRAESLRVFDLRAIEDALAHNRGGRGTGALASVLAEYGEQADTRSRAEERFLALVRRAGLPRPKVNEWLALPEGGGYRPDFLWPQARLIVEVDGRAHHARRRAFEHDRRRDRRLALAGFETRRYAATEVTSEPERVARELRAFLAARAAPER